MATVEHAEPKRFNLSSLLSVLWITRWIGTYDRQRFLQKDILAGVTVAAFAVPENLAYASLAGLPPVTGMYASMAAAFVYTFFGTSRQMSVGVTSALSIMVGSSLGGIAFAGPDEYLAAAQVTAIFAGLIAIVSGILRLGFVVNFISESVLVGFSAGAALFIASSQLAKLFGIPGVQGNFFERMWNVIKNLGDTNGWSLALGLTCLALLLILEERLPRLPSALIVVLLAIGVMYITDLEDRGVEVTGDIPSGLPSLGISDWPSGHLSELFALAAGCFLLSYIEGISCARTFASRGNYKIDANQELIANGAVNIAAGIAKGYPVGGSMSRSAVNESGGAQSPIAGATAAVLLAVVLLFLTGIFSKLPEPTLAAIVLVAVRSLIDIPAIRRLFRLSRIEFAAAMVTFGGVLLFDMLSGILIGAAFSALMVLKRAADPEIDVLGQVPGTRVFADMHRHPDNQELPGVLVVRVDGGIFYANAEEVQNDILQLTEQHDPKPELVVIDIGAMPTIDLAGLDMLQKLKKDLTATGATLRLAHVRGELRDTLRSAGLGDTFGSADHEVPVDQVISEHQAARGREAG